MNEDWCKCALSHGVIAHTYCIGYLIRLNFYDSFKSFKMKWNTTKTIKYVHVLYFNAELHPKNNSISCLLLAETSLRACKEVKEDEPSRNVANLIYSSILLGKWLTSRGVESSPLNTSGGTVVPLVNFIIILKIPQTLT